jgi:hypothetical protein
MPALSGYTSVSANAIEKRDWNQTVGQSGMTPTAFAFLIPIFIVIILCPFVTTLILSFSLELIEEIQGSYLFCSKTTSSRQRCCWWCDTACAAGKETCVKKGRSKGEAE